MMKIDSFDPRPVADRMPEMMPAAAHAAEMGTALLTPATKARPILSKSSREICLVHSRCNPSSSAIAKNEAFTGE